MNMYSWKGVIVGLCIVSLFGCSSVELVDGSRIGYGAITRNVAPGCSVRHPENCMVVRHSDNPYERGCLDGVRCRQYDPPPTPSSV